MISAMRKTLLIAALLGGTIMAQEIDPDLVKKGLQAYQAGDYAAAETSFRSALAGDSSDTRINYDLGTAVYKKASYAEAVKSFEKATAAADETLCQNAFYNLGNAHFQAGEFDKAAAAYQQALRLNPADIEAKYNLEMALRQQKEQEKQDQQQNQQQDSIQPSDYAKSLKAQAEILVAQQLYAEAYQLMQQGLRSDETVKAYNSFIKRLSDVSEINRLGEVK